jgi:hypothetical protein
VSFRCSWEWSAILLLAEGSMPPALLPSGRKFHYLPLRKRTRMEGTGLRLIRLRPMAKPLKRLVSVALAPVHPVETVC